jgi:uncharacterized protein involved in outer membrane biogenesis
VNSLYIGIGVAIIAALFTALVGPYFVDWSQYRSVFEREGQRIFGENVTVLGAAQVRLLPMPSIVLNDVVVGPVDQPDLKVNRLDVKIEISPLLKGDVRISELRLDHPVMRVGIDLDGKPVMPGMYNLFSANRAGPDVSSVGLELAEIVDGRIRLFDERMASEITIEGLNGTASAEALSGPMRLDGGARLGDHPFSFHFSTGKRGDHGQWPLRLSVNPTEGPYQLSAEGMLEPGDAPKLTGTANVQRLALSDGKSNKFEADSAPWQLQTQFAADVNRIGFDTINVSLGAADAGYQMAGTGSLAFGRRPSFDVALTARQFDLDRLIAQKIDDPVDPAVALSRLAGLAGPMSRLPIDGGISLGVGGIVLGGNALQDIDVEVHTRTDGWRIDRLNARLPGRSTIAFNGRVTNADGAAGPNVSGDLVLNSDQPQMLLQWLRRGETPALDPITFKGHVTAASDALRVDDMTFGLGAAKARGGFSYRTATALRGARLGAQVSADELNLDRANVLARLVAGAIAGDTPHGATALSPDLSLDLDAGTLIVADQPLKGVVAKVAFDGSALKIDQLAIKNAAGAALDVHGRIDKLATTPDGEIDGSIEAERLDGLVRLLDTTLPGQAWVKRLAAAAPALQHLKAKGRLTGDAGLDSSKVHLTLDGTSDASRLAVDARLSGRLDRLRNGSVDASVSIEGPDGGLVLRQVGIPAVSDGVSAGKLLVSVKGVPADGMDVTANAEIAGSRLTITGKASVDAVAVVTYSGEAQLKASDLRLPATMFGQALPSSSLSVPTEARARITGEGLKVSLKQISGRIIDAGVTGEAKIDLSQRPVRIDGSAQLTQADFGTLLELGLGPDALTIPPSKGNVWPTDVLAGPIFNALTLNLDLKADRLTIDAARGIDQFATKLRLRPGQVMFDDVAGRFAGGALTGAAQMTLAPDAPMAISGNLALKGAHLADVAWRRDERTVADGTFDLTTTFETSGRSIAALAAALSGSGAFSARDGTLRYVDPGAFGAIIAAADGGLDVKDDKIRTIFISKLDAGALPFSQIEAAFGIGAGVLRSGDVTVTSALARTTGSVSFDFGRWTLSGDWTLKVDPGRKGVVGAEPQVGIVFNGPLDNPKRSIDVAPLTAFLTLRAFEREVERVEDLQADIVERQRFARELKRLNDQKRDAEAAQKAAEVAARQKAIDDAKRAEEARKAEAARKAEEAKKAEDARKAADEAAKAAANPVVPVVPPSAPAPSTSAPAEAPSEGTTPAAKSTDRPAAQPDGAPVLVEPPPPKPAPPSGATKQSTNPGDGTSGDGASVATKPVEKPQAPIPVPMGKPTDSVPATTQSTRQGAISRSGQPRVVLPDLPPVIFIGPKPPVMPSPVPAVPTSP